MVATAYIGFVLSFAILGALVGIAAHFWRAHATMVPEDLGLGEPLNTLTRDDYQFEKHVVGAEWDDAGYWNPDSIRNLLYCMVSGGLTPIVLGAVFWSERQELVGACCAVLAEIGLNSPLCL